MSRNGLASRRSGVHGSVARSATPLELMDDVLEVFHRAGKTIDAGHNQGVARLHEVGQHLQLGSPITTGATGLLSASDAAAGRLEGDTLDREILVDSAARA